MDPFIIGTAIDLNWDMDSTDYGVSMFTDDSVLYVHSVESCGILHLCNYLSHQG